MNTMLKWMAGALGLAAGAYAGYVGVTWLRYGRPAHARAGDLDPLLDRFMSVYDIVERHHIRVAAPADVTLSAACDIDMQRSPVIRAIFRAREVMLGSEPDTAARPHELLAWAKSLGWAVLADVPDREVVMGAVTQPWEGDVVFRPLSPDAFTTFNDPGFVKIVWTLRADATSTTESVFRTETRAVATDDTARAKFRRYWSFLSPGIIVIRWTMLQPLKAEAERRAAVKRSADLESVLLKSRPKALRDEGGGPMAPWLRYLIAFVVFAHGFVYVRIGSLLPGPIKAWRGRSWILSDTVTGDQLRRVVVSLHVAAGIALLACAVAIALAPSLPGWWRPLAITGAAIGLVAFSVFWDGQTRLLFEEGVIGAVVSLVLLIGAIALASGRL